ncbi:MAG: AAA family ATPase [Candidatus Hydrogenedentota bacterium]|nr:MAG: AAA family ATPase [Candidatus Hydrogenedentota bacterium]
MEVVARPVDVTLDYCDHFGLERMPFNDSVNPEFFYRTECHETAFVRMMMCAKQHRAIGLIWGRSGTGKTLLAQMLLTGLGEDEFIPIIILATPGMSKMGLLGCTLEELDISRPPGRENTQASLSRIHSFLMETYSRGRRVVIIVDEAHFLPSEQLHMIRALTNLETPQEKLCTVILLAEETFPRRLRHRRYSSLRGRITMAAYLMPMSRSETEQYIKFRLMVAGSTEEPFDEESYELIHSRSGGVCREVSKLADNCLLEAHLRGESRVTQRIVEHCIQNSI